MPELPEVESARRLIESNCLGKRIRHADIVEDDKVIENIAPSALTAFLHQKLVTAVCRRGKHLWIEFEDGEPALLLHFGMTGGVAIKDVGGAHYQRYSVDADGASWPPKFCKMQLRFDDNTDLAFCDSRRFGRVRLIKDPLANPPLNALGFDPLLNMPPVEEFAAALSSQRRAIKALLLDQSFSAGIGNWVADECLFMARLHPEQPANSLNHDQARALHDSIVEVCKQAVEVNAEANKLPDDWLFHQRWSKGKAKAYIEGHAIEHITVGGRTSAYVPALQKLNKVAAKAAGKGAETVVEKAEAAEIEAHGLKGSTNKKKPKGSKEGGVKQGKDKNKTPKDDEQALDELEIDLGIKSRKRTKVQEGKIHETPIPSKKSKKKAAAGTASPADKKPSARAPRNADKAAARAPQRQRDRMQAVFKPKMAL